MKSNPLSRLPQVGSRNAHPKGRGIIRSFGGSGSSGSGRGAAEAEAEGQEDREPAARPAAGPRLPEAQLSGAWPLALCLVGWLGWGGWALLGGHGGAAAVSAGCFAHTRAESPRPKALLLPVFGLVASLPLQGLPWRQAEACLLVAACVIGENIKCMPTGPYLMEADGEAAESHAAWSLRMQIADCMLQIGAAHGGKAAVCAACVASGLAFLWTARPQPQDVKHVLTRGCNPSDDQSDVGIILRTHLAALRLGSRCVSGS